MTVQDNLPSILDDLERILSKSNTLFPLLPQGDRESILEVLERVRHYLVSLQNQSESSPRNTAEQLAAQQIAQVVLSRIDSRLGDWFKLLHGEVEQLRQQRQSLLREIQQHHQQHQQIVAHDLEWLVARCSEVLQQKLSQIQATVEFQRLPLEQFEQLQQQGDRALLSLDSSLRTVFDTLEKDLQGYYDSLSQGLERMHSLGQQGEAKFIAYFQRLTQQVERSRSRPSEAMLADVMTDLNEFNPIAPPSHSEEVLSHAEEDARAEPASALQASVAQRRRESLENLGSQEIRTIKALTDLIEPNVPVIDEKSHEGWYLGIDFGTEGLAAVLFNSKEREQFPLAWIFGAGEYSFRLSADVYCQPRNETQPLSFVLGMAAKARAKEKTGIFLDNLQESLNLADYKSEAIPDALQALFSSLIPANQTLISEFTVEAVGLSEDSFRQVLSQLEGVILSYPALWGETYQNRLREAVLKAKLVGEAERIFFVEDAIAVLGAHLSLILESRPQFEFPLTTLAIHAGAIATELALIDIPTDYQDYQKLTRRDFQLQSVAYGGNALDQDILVQLLYPQWLSQLNPSIPKLDEDSPHPGEPDLQKRENLKLRLQSHPIGRSFLEAAKLTKKILQQQEEFSTQLGNCTWGVKRQDFAQKVVLPYLGKLEDAIDSLLETTGKSPESIRKVICSGGTTLAVWDSLSPWLREKLPNATLIENADEENTGNQIAMGLACLPLFPLILERV